MIIKKYVANTLNEAMELVKQELGPDHVILTTRQIPRTGLLGWLSPSKIEITAAIDEADLKSYNNRKIPELQTKTSDVRMPQETAPMPNASLDQNLADLKSFLAQQEPTPQPTPAPTPAPIPQRTAAPTASATTYGDPRLTRMTQKAAPSPQTTTRTMEAEPAKVQAAITDFRKASQHLLSEFSGQKTEPEPQLIKTVASKAQETPDLTDLREIIREEMRTSQSAVSMGDMQHTDEEHLGSVRFLIGKGMSRGQAVEIEKKLQQSFGSINLAIASPDRSAYLNAMKKELTSRIKTTGPITLTRGKPTVVALVGPTGVGKTTTLAKIAVQYSHDLGKRVAVVSVDHQKLGAREQIQALADKFDLPLKIASTPEGMKGAVEQLTDYDLVLIDTGGRSQYQEGQIETLGHMLDGIPNVQCHLVLSSTTKNVDLFGTVKQFQRIPLTAVIFTKMDESIAYGMMVDLCHKTGLPVSYLTNGQRVPGDIKVADPEQMARTIMTRHNSAECEALRRMAAS